MSKYDTWICVVVAMVCTTIIWLTTLGIEGSKVKDRLDQETTLKAMSMGYVERVAYNFQGTSSVMVWTKTDSLSARKGL